MTGSRLTYRLQEATVIAALDRLIDLPHLILPAIGSALADVTKARFRSSSDPWGRRWAPLNPAYAAIKRGSYILRASGLLMRSITFRAGVDQVEVGSNRIYAAVHQFGATIMPKSKSALVFHLGNGIVFARKVTIPARPYLGFGAADADAVLEVVEVVIQNAVEG